MRADAVTELFGGGWRRWALALGLAVFVSARAAGAASDAWNGTWVLDVARSSAAAGEAGVPRAYRFTVKADGALRWEIPELQEVVTGRLDGAPTAVHRRAGAAGMTLAVRAVGPREWIYAVAKDGRAMGGGRMMLVDDGRAWVDLTWGPEGPGFGSELVYVKR